MHQNLMIKTVDFMGDGLLAVKDNDGVIWAGVKWFCNGLGLSDGQRQRQTTNIKEDMVLRKGVANLILPTNGGSQEVLCLKLDYIPLWLAKISITPTMKENNPQLVEKLVNYQLKAKDVLAKAFLPQEQPKIPQSYAEALRAAADEYEKRIALEEKMEQDKPKVMFADAVAASKDSILVRELAKILSQNGYPTGEKRLFEQLRKEGYLIRKEGDDYNTPTQKSVEMQIFEIKKTAITHSDGHMSVNKTPKVTVKGQQYFLNKFLKA